MKFFFLLLPIFAFAQQPLMVSPQGSIVASFSDQGGSTIKTITGHSAPKGVTLLAVNVCSNYSSTVSVSGSRVLSSIATQSTQKPSIYDPTVVGLVLSTYGDSTKSARLIALAKYMSFAGAVLTASGAIKANRGWNVGLQLGTGAIDAYVGTLPSSANLINIGRNLLQGEIVLGPMECKSGLAIAGYSTHLNNEQVVIN